MAETYAQNLRACLRSCVRTGPPAAETSQSYSRNIRPDLRICQRACLHARVSARVQGHHPQKQPSLTEETCPQIHVFACVSAWVRVCVRECIICIRPSLRACSHDFLLRDARGLNIRVSTPLNDRSAPTVQRSTLQHSVK